MRTVIITGASRGIGAACAVAFAKSGYNIIINYNKSKEKAENIAKVISNSYGVDALCIKTDVCDKTQVDEMIEIATQKFGFIDVLVNNAGISFIKLFTDTTKSEWDSIISTNLTSVYNCCHAVLPSMISKHSGSIINISSMWGQVGASCEVAYSASKAGVIGLTKALAKEVAPSGIRVNCIAPGVIMTDMMESVDEDTINMLKKETPLGVLGTAKNIADSAVFLASSSSEFVTGQVLAVNGGMVI